VPSLNDTFKAVGVTTARDKILAVCNAPALFYDNVKLTEDQLMTTFVARQCGRMLLDELMPAKRDVNDNVNNSLHYGALSHHIMNSVFDVPDKDARRNIAYSMADPKFLDELIAGIKQMMLNWDRIHAEYRNNLNQYLLQETGYPMFYLNQEYIRYHELSKHSRNT
jgi:hypothetical protein